MQVVLLRFLESGEIQRIGADRSHTRVNVRLITATNSRPRGGDRVRRVPRGSVLPPQRHPPDHSAASRAHGGHPAAHQLLPELLQPPAQGESVRDLVRRDGRAHGLSLARQHPRAQERRRARGAQDRRTEHPAQRPAVRRRSIGGGPGRARRQRPRRRVPARHARRGTGDADARAWRVVLVGGVSDFHVARSHAHRPAPASSRSGSRARTGTTGCSCSSSTCRRRITSGS